MGSKRLNSANPGVKRPLRISDLQDLWDAVQGMVQSTESDGGARIVSGFNWDSSGDLTPGYLAFKGKMYYYPATVGDRLYDATDIYVKEQPGATRVFADGSTQVFSYDNIVTANSAGATYVGNTDDLDEMKSAYVGYNSITNDKIAVGSIKPSRLRAGSIGGFTPVSFECRITPAGVLTWSRISPFPTALNNLFNLTWNQVERVIHIQFYNTSLKTWLQIGMTNMLLANRPLGVLQYTKDFGYIPGVSDAVDVQFGPLDEPITEEIDAYITLFFLIPDNATVLSANVASLDDIPRDTEPDNVE